MSEIIDHEEEQKKQNQIVGSSAVYLFSLFLTIPYGALLIYLNKFFDIDYLKYPILFLAVWLVPPVIVSYFLKSNDVYIAIAELFVGSFASGLVDTSRIKKVEERTIHLDKYKRIIKWYVFFSLLVTFFALALIFYDLYYDKKEMIFRDAISVSIIVVLVLGGVYLHIFLLWLERKSKK